MIDVQIARGGSPGEAMPPRTTKSRIRQVQEMSDFPARFRKRRRMTVFHRIGKAVGR